jgi:hypothetical protein
MTVETFSAILEEVNFIHREYFWWDGELVSPYINLTSHISATNSMIKDSYIDFY